MTIVSKTVTFDKKNRDKCCGAELCETITETGELLEDVSATGRKRPWREHRMAKIGLIELFHLGEKHGHLLSESRMKDLEECADELLFLQDAEGNRRLKQGNFCRVRVCPMCNWRRSLKLFSQVSAVTDAILAEKKARFIFVTLTVQNVRGDVLRDTIDRLNKAFTYITAKSRTFAPARKLKENLLGYMKAEEITYNAERDDFHPHIHAILEVRPTYFSGDGYIKQKDWTALWRAALGVDYDPLVDVRNIKGGTAKAVAEVAKYPVKMDSILKIADRDRAAKALMQLYTAIFRRRLVTFGGDFKEYRRRLQLDDVETGDLTHVETEEKTFNAVAQVLFKWRADVGAYIC
jgi:plasmid rolling circle replication initiator protein Rep